MEENINSNLLNKKNIIILLLIGIMVLVIPVAVSLVQQQQRLESKATVEPITFTAGGNVGTDTKGNQTTSNPVVQVELNSPLGPPEP